MKKQWIEISLIGIVSGLAANQLVCFVASKALRLGYYAACPAWLPERVGGEMNAVLLQMILFSMIGIIVTLLVFKIRNMGVSPGQK